MKINATPTVTSTWRGLRLWTIAATLWALLLLTGVVRAQVTNVIYQDNFARVGPLDGSAPRQLSSYGMGFRSHGTPPA